jgi:hypothetical protein
MTWLQAYIINYTGLSSPREAAGCSATQKLPNIL